MSARKPHNPSKFAMPRFSTAEKTGFAAYIASLLLLPLDARLAALPASVFLLLCIIAPLLPGFSFFLPIISRGRSGRQAVALTFDDGPDPISTPLLLDLLARYGVRATFFVTGRRAERYPDLVKTILAQGHTLGNHSYSHDNLIMFKSHPRVVREITAAQGVFQQFGVQPLAFRPPVGVTSPRLPGALALTGLYVVNFSNRGADLGNRRVAHLSQRILKRLRADDIIMLHDIEPRPPAQLDCWIAEVDQLLAGIGARGIAIRPLDELIGRPVMITLAARIAPQDLPSHF